MHYQLSQVLFEDAKLFFAAVAKYKRIVNRSVDLTAEAAAVARTLLDALHFSHGWDMLHRIYTEERETKKKKVYKRQASRRIMPIYILLPSCSQIQLSLYHFGYHSPPYAASVYTMLEFMIEAKQRWSTPCWDSATRCCHGAMQMALIPKCRLE